MHERPVDPSIRLNSLLPSQSKLSSFLMSKFSEKVYDETGLDFDEIANSIYNRSLRNNSSIAFPKPKDKLISLWNFNEAKVIDYCVQRIERHLEEQKEMKTVVFEIICTINAFSAYCDDEIKRLRDEYYENYPPEIGDLPNQPERTRSHIPDVYPEALIGSILWELRRSLQEASDEHKQFYNQILRELLVVYPLAKHEGERVSIDSYELK
jgi:hypothetical protein